MEKLTIGVLALQGAFAKHIAVIKELGAHPIEVRTPAHLSKCDGLIIPGGESTAMLNLLERNAFFPNFFQFASEKPIFGTCAGLIIMTNCLKILDVEVERNGYGPQIASFSAEIEIDFGKRRPKPFHAIFIRAPRITQVGPKATVLASIDSEPILVQQGHYLAATFHPELTEDTSLHHHFLTLCKTSAAATSYR